MTEHESAHSISGRIIWQYWETRGEKPAFIDGLFAIAKQNAGVRVIQVTPETLPEYLPDLPKAIFQIEEMAHKADMLRTRLIARYGGMWLDSDAMVLSDLNFIFDYLDQYDFVGFNDLGQLAPGRPWVRINCFAARRGSAIMQAWVSDQDEKLPKLKFDWQEIGTNLLHPICLARKDIVKILPFETIAPVPWNRVAQFGSLWRTPAEQIDRCVMVMLSNKSLESRFPQLRKMSVVEIANEGRYISHFMRRAMDKSYMPPTRLAGFISGLRRLLRCAA